MNPINFRDTTLFNTEIQTAIQHLYNKRDIEEKHFDALQGLFFKYYLQNGLASEEAFLEAKRALSQFKQHFVYFAHHNYDPSYAKTLVTQLIKSDNFFYIESDQPRSDFFWYDPKQLDTTLLSLCRNGDIENLRLFLAKITPLLGGETSSEFQAYMTRCNVRGYTPIDSVCKDGDLAILTLLLEKIMFDLSTQKNRDFFIHSLSICDYYGCSPFQSACKNGRLNIVTLLLEKVAICYGGKNTRGFKDYISQSGTDGCSALYQACKAAQSEVVKYLLKIAKEIFNDEEFFNFLEKQNNNGFTPLNVVAKSASHKKCSQEQQKIYDKIKRILIIYEADPDKHNVEGHTARQNAPTHWKWNKIDFTCYSEAKHESPPEMGPSPAKKPKSEIKSSARLFDQTLSEQHSKQPPANFVAQVAPAALLASFMQGFMGYFSGINQNQSQNPSQTRSSGSKRPR